MDDEDIAYYLSYDIETPRAVIYDESYVEGVYNTYDYYNNTDRIIQYCKDYYNNKLPDFRFPMCSVGISYPDGDYYIYANINGDYNTDLDFYYEYIYNYFQERDDETYYGIFIDETKVGIKYDDSSNLISLKVPRIDKNF